jgi:serine-type D-Ala-D-Ala carboxypeptidase/endopeptidase (penicillin-binding protein 4)
MIPLVDGPAKFFSGRVSHMKCTLLRLALVSLLASLLARPLSADDDLAAKIDEVINRPEYKQAHWGALIVDAKTGSTIYERNAERLFAPASTTKLFSVAAALAILGPDYRFTTPVYRRGEVKDGVLRGDLVLVASGDLTFGGRMGKNGETVFANNDHTYANSGLMVSSLTDTNPVQALDDLARQIVKAGIKEVTGEVLIDERLFNRSRSSGSGPELLTPMIVNDNVVDLIVTPGKKPGESAKIRMRPETAYFQLDAEVVTVAQGVKPLPFNLQEISPTTLSLRGEIAMSDTPAVRVYYVTEPMLFARALFIESLRRSGVRVQASLYRPARFDLPAPEAYETLPRIASFESAPLVEALKVTMKVSHNLYASTLPLLVAAKHGERTLEEGLRRQGAFLKKIGVPVDTISFAGAAGGLAADLATPAATVKLLQAMAKRPEADDYFGMLPVLGVDGTLAEVLPAVTPAKGKVQAKTGTLIFLDLMNDRVLLRSKALAGMIETAKGTKLYFALFLNDVPLAPGVPTSRDGKVLAKLCELVYQHGP